MAVDLPVERVWRSADEENETDQAETDIATPEAARAGEEAGAP